MAPLLARPAQRRAFVFAFVIALLSAKAAGAKCALFPPPFDLTEGEAAAFLHIPPHMPPDGYWETPALKKDCDDLDKAIGATAAFYNGKLMSVTFEGIAVGESGLKDFDGFVNKYVGEMPDPPAENAMHKRFEHRRAEWKKPGYFARYSAFPAGEGENGVYRVHLRISSDKFAALAAEHYKKEEEMRRK